MNEEELPDTQDTMLISVLDGNSLNTYIIDLMDFDIQEDDFGMVYLTFHKNFDLPFENGSKFVLCVSDDPYMTWAGDWQHLGTFRIRVIMKDAKKVQRNCWICKKEDFEYQGGLPDRRIYGKNIPELSFW
jgi:hypothetical protein